MEVKGKRVQWQLENIYDKCPAESLYNRRDGINIKVYRETLS